MRKFLLTLVVLVAGAMSAWAESVAKIGETYYGTLAEAVAAAQNGETITMLQDVILGAAVKVEGKTITLDLNGKTVSGTCNASQSCLVYIENNASLTVKDDMSNGKLTYAAGSSNVGWTIDVKGALVLESGTIELTGSWNIGYAVDVRPNAWGTPYTNPTIFTMNGGRVISSDGAVRVASSSSSTYSNVSASFVMNGGYIDAVWDGVFIQQSDAAYDVLNFTINGGTVESDLNPVRVFGPAATSYVNGQDCMDIAFNGGVMEYTGTETYTWIIEGILRAGGGSSIETITESGSIAATEEFVQANELPLPEGYEWKDNGDGTFGVVEKTTTYEINSFDEFLDFRDAVNGGNSFEDMTVRLNVDLDFHELDWTENIGNAEHPFKGIFDGQGKSIKNLYFASRQGVARDYLGLFGVISGGAVIKNVVLEDLLFVPGGGGQYVGTIVAYASNGVTIEGNVVNQLKVEGTEYVGGLVGYASNDVVIVGNTVQDLTVQGKISVGAIAGKILAGAEVVDNTIINVLVGASGDANTAAVVAGTFENGVIISRTVIQDVKVNGTPVDSNVLGTAVKVGDVYYTTLEAAYNDESGDVTSIELLGKHELSEAVSYTQKKDVVVNGDLTYKRSLIANWNPLYLPFKAEVDANKYKVAGFYSADDSGITLQLIAPEEGKVKLAANTPYVICYTEEASKTLTIDLNEKVLEAAEENNATWMDETTYANGFVIKGNYKMVTGAELTSNDWVVSTAGKWGRLKGESTLKPYRLILTTPADFNASANAKSFSMRVLDGTTLVEDIELDLQHEECIFDLSGRRVDTMTEGGIYIVNGKKVIF